MHRQRVTADATYSMGLQHLVHETLKCAWGSYSKSDGTVTNWYNPYEVKSRVFLTLWRQGYLPVALVSTARPPQSQHQAMTHIICREHKSLKPGQSVSKILCYMMFHIAHLVLALSVVSFSGIIPHSLCTVTSCYSAQWCFCVDYLCTMNFF